MADTRISCNIPSDYNALLLSEWARQTGRPLANLGSVLLEEGLNAALREKRIPEFIIEEANQRFKKRNEAKPEPIENIVDAQLEGEATREALELKIKEDFDNKYAKFLEAALKKTIPELQELSEELPCI